MTMSSPPIACTLSGRSREERIASIGRLARDALRGQERDGLTLRLQYSREAAERVRAIVCQEQVCCAFLEFDLQQGSDDLLLTIRAPEAARDVANEVFGHFTASEPFPVTSRLRP